MIRAFVSVLVLSFASVSLAAPACNSNLVLSCQALYQAYDGLTQELVAQSNFGDEHWDEPSLANCASTVYFTTGNATVRVYATQDLAANLTSVSAQAVQLEDENNARSAKYSRTISAMGTTGMALNMGSLALPTAIPMGSSVGKTVYVGCRVK